MHAILTDDAYNLLISSYSVSDTLFPGVNTSFDLNEAKVSLERWIAERTQRSLIPIACFSKETSLYYVFRITKHLADTTETDNEVWVSPYTAMIMVRTIRDADVVRETLIRLEYPDVGILYLYLPMVLFPKNPNIVNVVNANIGGSTGAKLVSWGQQLYVMKVAKGKRAGHLAEECLADRFYMEFGAQVPPFKKYVYEEGVVKLGVFLPNGKPIQNEEEKIILQKHFIVDAFLANWDVLGMEADNVLVYNGIPVRIDNGGSLRYRAQGQPKGKAFGASVNEIYSMRCKIPPNSPYCSYYEDLTDEQVAEQIALFVPKATEVIEKLYDLGLIEDELKTVLESRVTWLRMHKMI